MEIRQNWGKQDRVQIFSNTHQEWYTGEIVSIEKDQEGEWLNVVWTRSNGEAMSKQVQRFSTDVRPPPGEKPPSEEARELSNRTKDFARRAPPFSRTLRSSTFTHPATQAYRRSKKLDKVIESFKETNIDEEAVTENNTKKMDTLTRWKPKDVQNFIGSLGKAYTKYKVKFRDVSGMDLLQMDEDNFVSLNIPKIHRNRILLEIARLSDQNYKELLEEAQSTEILNWDEKRMAQWCRSQPSPLYLYDESFLNHGIIGLLLFSLDEEDLKTIGVKPIHRKKILERIAWLNEMYFPDEKNKQKNDSNNDTNQNDEDNPENDEKSADEPYRGSQRRQSVQMAPMSFDGLGGGSNVSVDKGDFLALLQILETTFAVIAKDNKTIAVKNACNNCCKFVSSLADKYISSLADKQQININNNINKNINNNNNNINSNNLNAMSSSSPTHTLSKKLGDMTISVTNTSNAVGGAGVSAAAATAGVTAAGVPVSGSPPLNSTGSPKANIVFEDSPFGHQSKESQQLQNYLNTLQNKSGHKRRQSLTIVDKELDSLKESDENDNSASEKLSPNANTNHANHSSLQQNDDEDSPVSDLE